MAGKHVLAAVGNSQFTSDPYTHEWVPMVMTMEEPMYAIHIIVATTAGTHHHLLIKT